VSNMLKDEGGADCSTAITESAVVHREMKALKEKIDELERVVRENTPMRESEKKE
jgi:hypothetical protein